MADTIKLKGDTLADWTSINPILGDRVVGLETDTRKFKVGDGVTRWADLQYWADGASIDDSDFLKQGVRAGLLQQDLADVDLVKLAEKVTDSKVLEDTKTEIERLKTDISASQLPTFSYRGKKAPAFTGGPFKAYYVNITGLDDALMSIAVPTSDKEGAVFTLRNSDKTNLLTLTVPAGTTLNGKTDAYVIDPSEVYLMVKKTDTNWITIYNGLLPNSIKDLMDLVKSNLTGQLNTIPEIQAQLKDRLHLFSEIQNEFKDELHTYDQLKNDGFIREYYSIGHSGSNVEPTNDSWIMATGGIEQELFFNVVLAPPAYIVIRMPMVLSNRINHIVVNNVNVEATYSKLFGTTTVYFVSPTPVPIGNIRVSVQLKASVANPTLSVGGNLETFPNITEISFVDSDVTRQPGELNKVSVVPYISVAGINDKLPKIRNIKVLKGLVDQAAGDATTVEITTQIGIANKDEQEKLINRIEVAYPVRFTFNDAEQIAEISVDNVFDFSKPEGLFLRGRAITYLKDFDGTAYHADVKDFTKEVYEGKALALTGDEIQIKRPAGLYTGFPKAPLICYGRMAFASFAPRDGFIEIGLRDVTTKATLLGSYGETISRTRSYLANEKLYYLDFFSVFEVDFIIKNVEFYIKHSFGQDYDLKVSDDVDGGTCLMMQFVSQDYKTGEALQEVRNQYNLVLPFEIFELTAGQPLAGYSLELNGVIPRTGVTGVFNRQGFCEIGTADKEAYFELNPTGLNITAKDDSTPSYAYISLMLNAELTEVFKGDNLILTVNLTLKDVFSALDIIPITWNGIANEIPKGIVGSIPDNFIPVPTDAQWTFDNANAHFIQMDMSDFNPRTITADFVVPQRAINFGVLVVPHAVANAMKMHVQGLSFTPKVTDVAPMLKPVVRLGDSYLFSSVRYGQYTWGFPPTTDTDKIQGVALGTNPTQISINKRVYGDAAIKLIKINGLNYHVMEFASAGKAKIDSTWTLTRPKSHFVHPSHTAHVYFAVATSNGSGGYNLSKITQSEATHSIDVEYPTVVQVTTPTFTYDVTPGTILVAMGTCSTSNDVYVAMSHGGDRPITIDVEYTETVSGTSSDEPISSLYTEDELGGVWEIKTAADGHVESQKVGDLPENTVHHITRGNLNLNDFAIVDGVISIKNVITQEEQELLDKVALIDSELVITQNAIDNNCYIELDFKAGKPVLTAKQR